MLQVQKLLVKYKLSMSDIEKKEEKSNVVTNYTDICITNGKWKGSLTMLICENFSCYAYAYKGNYERNSYMSIIGKEDDVEICKITLDYAINFINSQVSKIKKEYKRNRKSVLGVERTYAVAFINGLYDAFESQKESNKDEWGLILQKDEKVEEEYGKLTLRKASKYKAQYCQDRNLYDKAYEDGKSFNISNKLENNCNNDCKALGY